MIQLKSATSYGLQLRRVLLALRAGYTMRSLCSRAATMLLAGVSLLAGPAAADSQPVAVPNGWHLLRTTNPGGGAEAVSIIHTVDLIRSDPDLAGLMLRCADTGVDVVLVVVSPFPPAERPSITVATGGKEWHFEARVVSPGAELLLPSEAADLAAGPWQSERELAIKVASPMHNLAGIVPIDGMGAALTALTANCPMAQPNPPNATMAR